MVHVVIAEHVQPGDVERGKNLGDLGFQSAIGFELDIRASIAKIDHDIRAGCVGVLDEFVQQRQRHLAFLGHLGGTVVNVGHQGQAYGLTHCVHPVPGLGSLAFLSSARIMSSPSVVPASRDGLAPWGTRPTGRSLHGHSADLIPSMGSVDPQ